MVGVVLDVVKVQIAIWREKAEIHSAAREDYRAAWGKAYLASDGKTADARKAAADIATSDLRLKRDQAEIAASAEWQLLLALRGKIEGSQQPGQHFGEST
jgi:hypothetical protein